MRFVLATALLLGGLAACGGPSETAPPPAPAAAEPMPAAPPPPAAGTVDGHYAGNATGTGAHGCAREEGFDITVANNGVSGTVTPQGSGSPSSLSGHVGPNGKAVIHLQPQGAGSPRGTLVGTFANGQFTGRLGSPCRREVTAIRQ
jgi:hypothetical protein